MVESEWATEFIKSMEDPTYIRKDVIQPKEIVFNCKEFTELFVDSEKYLILPPNHQYADSN